MNHVESTERTQAISIGIQFTCLNADKKDLLEDYLLELAFLSVSPDSSITKREASQKVNLLLGEGAQLTTRASVNYSIERLIGRKCLLQVDKEKYALTPERRNELQLDADQAQRLWNAAFSVLIKHEPLSSKQFESAVWQALTLLFEHYAMRLLQPLEGKKIFPVDDMVLSDIAAKVCDKHKIEEKSTLERLLRSFLTTNKEEYNEIKFLLTQNHYAVRILGFDKNGLGLRRSWLKGARIYIDTNVIIKALLPTARGHQQANSLLKHCRELGIEICVCEISMKEFSSWLESKKPLMIEYADELVRKHGSIIDEMDEDVLEAFQTHYHHSDSANAAVFLKALDHARIKLEDSYGLTFVNDAWFMTNLADARTMAVIEELRRRSQRLFDLKRSSKIKSEEVLLHDALLLRWVLHKEFTEGHSRRHFVITFDETLPGIQSKIQNRDLKHETIPVLTVEAMLQWLVPFVQKNFYDSAMEVFASSVENQLLPKNRIFNLNDFAVFEEVAITLDQLDTDQVREFISYSKSIVGKIDINDPLQRAEYTRSLDKYIISSLIKQPRSGLKEGLNIEEETGQQLGETISSHESEITSDDLEVVHTTPEAMRLEDSRKLKKRLQGVAILLLPIAILSLVGLVKLTVPEVTNFWVALGNVNYLAGPLCGFFLYLWGCIYCPDLVRGHWVAKLLSADLRNID